MSALVDQRADADDDIPAVEGEDHPDAEDFPDSGETGVVEAPQAPSGSTRVVQDDPAPTPAQLRVDFGAHLEANYQRLVAQLYAITLDPGEAHEVVQDAYSRAWRHWVTVGRSPDPSAWVRRVAVRSTVRSWRGVLVRLGIRRPQPPGDGIDPRTSALLAALGRLPATERRAVVLSHMAGVPLAEIAALEQVSPATVQARLSRARNVITEGMADVLPEVLGVAVEDDYGNDYGDDYDVDTYDSEGENR